MLKVNNVRILYKILACFALLGIVVGGAIWFATSHMKQIDSVYSSIISSEVKAAKAIIRANTRVYNFGRLSWRIIVETDPVDMKRTKEEIDENFKDFVSQIDIVKKHAPKFATRAERARQEFEEISKDFLLIEKATSNNNNVEALRLSKLMAVKTGQFRKGMVQITEDIDKDMQLQSDKASEQVNYTILLTAGSVSTALTLVLAIAFALVQFGVARPIAGLVGELNKLATGNFQLSLPWVGRKDEIGQIADAVAEMAGKVSSTIAEIKSSGREVTNASAEISTSTTDLSQRTEEQAASLEQTSAAMEELSATVRKNAESAQQANQSANATRDVADRGGQVVAKAVEAMAKIEDSSRKISDIIGVIDEIARQTNLLALNAAVEAARAGEAGRGFAVVASEVRSLAQRSSQAAKDIKDLITNSNGQVKDGVDLVNRAGASLTEIVESIKSVAVIVGDIANASLEQATGIEQINKALTQMDEVTQQNSALVEENAATAKTLEHQAKAMDEQVSYFQIAVGGNSGMARAPSRSESHAPKARSAAFAKKTPTPFRQAAPARRAAASAGPARGMQTALATAVNADDWKEF